MRKAIDNFYADKQRYPADLTELVPNTCARSRRTRSRSRRIGRKIQDRADRSRPGGRHRIRDSGHDRAGHHRREEQGAGTTDASIDMSPYSEPLGRAGGFTLAGLIVILTIIMVFVAYTVPRQWSDVMQREREQQTIFVMKQYARAINEFQKKRNGYPGEARPAQGSAPAARHPRREGRVRRSAHRKGRLGPRSADSGRAGTRPRRPIESGANPAPARTGDHRQPTGRRRHTDYDGPFVGVRPPVTGKSII